MTNENPLSTLTELLNTTKSNYPNILPEIIKLIEDNKNDSYLKTLLPMVNYTKNNLNDDKTCGMLRHQLWVSLQHTLKHKDYQTFKLGYETILVFFIVNKDNKFDIVSLTKHDLSWPGDEISLKEYQKMITMITAIVDTSSVKPSTIDFGRLFPNEENLINNLRRYYDV